MKKTEKASVSIGVGTFILGLLIYKEYFCTSTELESVEKKPEVTKSSSVQPADIVENVKSKFIKFIA